MIAVAGESLVDLIATGDDLRAVPGGGPYNVARTVARLGRPCCYVGALATDRFGVRLREALRADGVDDRWAPSSADPTTLALAQIGPDGAATYAFYVDRTSAADVSVEQACAALRATPRLLYVGTLGLVLEPAATSYEALVAEADPDVLVAIDPNCRPAVVRDHDAYRARITRLLRRADLVKVSTDDLDYLVPAVPAVEAAEQLQSLGPAVVLLTDGGNDLQVVTQDRRRAVPVPAVDVVDTVGAGDSFLGAVLAFWDAQGLGRLDLADEGPLLAAVELGVAVSGITCGRRGADPPRADELDASLAVLVAPRR